MAGKQGNNKIAWTDDQLLFLKANWQAMTAQQLADNIGLKRTVVRMKLYKLGLKKIEMEYWTPEQIDCLMRNYKTVGDTELTEIFKRRWKKAKGWHKKHIEKKRRQMGLERTKAETAYIKKRNKEKGRFAMCPVKAWVARGGAAPENDIRVWMANGVPFKVIKIKSRWVQYAPWYYREYIGEIPKRYVVRVKDGNPLNIVKENLELCHITRHGPKNKRLSLEYQREQQKAILKTKIARNEKQIKRLEQSSF